MDQLKQILENKYGNLLFTRVKTTHEAGVYAARVETLLGKDERFIMIVVPFHMAIKPYAKLSELHWLSFQTRSLETTYNIQKQGLSQLSIPNIKLQVRNRTNDHTVYYCPFPVEIELLHDPKKRTAYQYNDNITLSYALGTWQCVINRID